MTNRNICSVLDELRTAVGTMGFLTLPISKRHISSLVEEAQTLANRMEAALYDKRDLGGAKKPHGRVNEQAQEVEAYLGRLREERQGLSEKIDELAAEASRMEHRVECARKQMAEFGCAFSGWGGCVGVERGCDEPLGEFGGFGDLFEF